MHVPFLFPLFLYPFSTFLPLKLPSSFLPFFNPSLHHSTFLSLIPSLPPPLSFSVCPPDPPESFDFKPLCTVKIDDADQLSQLKEAVEDLYYFEFVFGEAFFSDWALLCTCIRM